MAKLPKCLVGMECCGGANYWAREISKFGHTVKLMNPRFVKPYIKSDKNDSNDAEGICEAVTRPNMRFAIIKTSPQQDLQSLHRVRARLVKNRTMLSNQMRGMLLEEGIVIAKGFKALKSKLTDIFSENIVLNISGLLKSLIWDSHEELKMINNRIEDYDNKLDQISIKDNHCKKLLKIDGVGPKTATAIVAMVGNASEFKDGRQLSAYFGLVPRQNSSGNREQLLGITKRGDPYIRGLLIHGARSLLRHNKGKEAQTERMKWFLKKIETRGENKAVVALANKQARIIWSVLNNELDYRSNYEELLRERGLSS